MAELIPITAEPRGDDIIATLELALELARADNLSSVAVAYVLRSGAVGSERSKAPNAWLLVGALERCKAGIVKQMDG